MPEFNGTMMQYFHWYNKADGTLWKEATEKSRMLYEAGITAVWLPPAYKGLGGAYDTGYGVYDMYDLGEFDQKGSRRTKYGTKDEYVNAVNRLREAGLQVYADTVLNHRIGGDEAETVNAVPFSQNDRIHPKGPMQQVRTYTCFTFPGRKDRHSSFRWNHLHFDAADYNDLDPDCRGNIFLFEGKQFDDYVSLENGNFSYLMGCDIDFQSEEVRNEIKSWGKWYLDTVHIDGFRLDAIKHISSWFFPEWLDSMENHAGRELFTVGEYWSPDIASLHWYLDNTGGKMSVFDVPLHYNFHYAGKTGASYDMRRILDGTLMQQRPWQAVTFVENHDSQPLQSLESTVEPWFKPLAYAIILLRREGYPCIFYADYFGAEYEDYGRDGNRYNIVLPSHRYLIDIFLTVRKNFIFGSRTDYFDHWNIIGWTYGGDEEHPGTTAVVMSAGPGGGKWMNAGQSGISFTDLTGHVKTEVKSNPDGWAEFFCNGGSVSVWVQKK